MIERYGSSWSSWSSVAILASLTLLAGCTGTDVLSSGSVPQRIQLEIVNPGTETFDQAVFNFVQLTVRPLDPDADAALEGNLRGLLFRAKLIDIDGAPVQVLSDTALSAGRYRVEQLVLADPFIFTEDPFELIDCGFFGTLVIDSTEDVLFDVVDGDVTLSILLDKEAFLEVCRNATNPIEFTDGLSDFLEIR